MLALTFQTRSSIGSSLVAAAVSSEGAQKTAINFILLRFFSHFVGIFFVLYNFLIVALIWNVLFMLFEVEWFLIVIFILLLLLVVFIDFY